MKQSVFVALSAILLGTTSCSTMKTARYLTDYSELASYDHIAMAKFIPRNNYMDPLVLNIKHTLATYFEEVPHVSSYRCCFRKRKKGGNHCENLVRRLCQWQTNSRNDHRGKWKGNQG